MSRFEPVDGRSELALAGESSVHPLHTTTTVLTGFFEATIGVDGELDLAQPISGQIEVPVDSLKSNNALIDREMRNRLNTRRYPKILAKLVTIRQHKATGRYVAVGDLTFHGVTQRLEDELVVQQVNENVIEIKGEISLDIRQFKVTPPKLFMLKVYPEVKIQLLFVLERVGEGSS